MSYVNPLQVAVWEQQFIEEQKAVTSVFLGQNMEGYNNTVSAALDIRPFEAANKNLRVLNVGDFVAIPEGRHETFEFQDIQGKKRIANAQRQILPIIYDKFQDRDKGEIELDPEIIRQAAIKASKAKEIAIAKAITDSVTVVNWDNTTSTLTLDQDGGTIINNTAGAFNQAAARKIKSALIKSELIGAMSANSQVELFITQDEMEDLNAQNDLKSVITVRPGEEKWFSFPMVEGMLIKETAGGISKPILEEVTAGNPPTTKRKCLALAPRTIYYEESEPIITHLTSEQMRQVYTDGSLTSSGAAGNFIDSGAWVFYFKIKVVRQLGKGVIEIDTTPKV
ncbi:MAG: hypothetical protein LBH46_01740 [Rickettsiales bacterium]|jgi:hypothetical protein|nr:hypothetical protein [Rickettsiales bacterium]